MADVPIVGLVQKILLYKFLAETHMGLRETCLEKGSHRLKLPLCLGWDRPAHTRDYKSYATYKDYLLVVLLC